MSNESSKPVRDITMSNHEYSKPTSENSQAIFDLKPLI